MRGCDSDDESDNNESSMLSLDGDLGGGDRRDAAAAAAAAEDSVGPAPGPGPVPAPAPAPTRTANDGALDDGGWPGLRRIDRSGTAINDGAERVRGERPPMAAAASEVSGWRECECACACDCDGTMGDGASVGGGDSTEPGPERCDDDDDDDEGAPTPDDARAALVAAAAAPGESGVGAIVAAVRPLERVADGGERRRRGWCGSSSVSPSRASLSPRTLILMRVNEACLCFGAFFFKFFSISRKRAGSTSSVIRAGGPTRWNHLVSGQD